MPIPLAFTKLLRSFESCAEAVEKLVIFRKGDLNLDLDIPNYLNNDDDLLEDTTGLDVIKLFSYSTQLSTKFILLINVKMPTIVGILTFISMINTTSERF